jgi:hypothetical protein
MVHVTKYKETKKERSNVLTRSPQSTSHGLQFRNPYFGGITYRVKLPDTSPKRKEIIATNIFLQNRMAQNWHSYAASRFDFVNFAVLSEGNVSQSISGNE